jgi:hypothetical protein
MHGKDPAAWIGKIAELNVKAARACSYAVHKVGVVNVSPDQMPPV